MSLKAIAEETLARLRGGEMGRETKKETDVKQVKQPVSCFTDDSAGFTPMKHAEAQETGKNGACFTVSFPRGGTRETKLREWQAALASIDIFTPPIGLARWEALFRDAVELFNTWGERAAGLGWGALDLFGVDVDNLTDPYGAGGLAWRLDGRPIVMMGEDVAMIAKRMGGREPHARGGCEHMVLLWDLNRNER